MDLQLSYSYPYANGPSIHEAEVKKGNYWKELTTIKKNKHNRQACNEL